MFDADSQATPIVRAALTFAGGFIAAHGWMDSETLTQLIGVAVPAAVGVWGVLEKRTLKQKMIFPPSTATGGK